MRVAMVMLGAALVATAYARFAGPYIGQLARALRTTAAALMLVAFVLVPDLSAQRAMVGVSLSEVARFKARFEKALRQANLTMKDAAICMYDRDDHARLRHDLDNGDIKVVRMDRLPAPFHRAWLELQADEKQLDIVTAETLERAARVATLVPKGKPCSMEMAVCGSHSISQAS